MIQAEILKDYSYLNQITQIIHAPENVLAHPITTFNAKLIGSRFSGKSIQVFKYALMMSFQQKWNVATTIWRYEVAGASETFDEVLATMEDIYEVESDLKNTNISKRRLKFDRNIVQVKGYVSNRKKKTPKLGTARRGVKKNIQINIFEEANEFTDEKQIHLLQQATGGAKYVINIFIANPWVLSNWFVSSINRALPFNEKELRNNGQQFKSEILPEKKTMNIYHISNHRINPHLEDAQRQQLYDAWDISEHFARVVDLGMPGVSDGLIFAPLMHRIMPAPHHMPTKEFKGGLDWGTSTASGGSATALVLGRVGKDFQTLALDDGYYHSNSTQMYKSDDQLIADVVKKAMEYAFKHKKEILETASKKLKIYYDWAAMALGKALKDELSRYKERVIADMIIFWPCTKYEVPTRIDIVSLIMSQGRMKVDWDKLPELKTEWENAQWEDTKLVSGRPTRINEDDHVQDAVEYMIGADLMKFATNNYLKLNKPLKTIGATGYRV